MSDTDECPFCDEPHRGYACDHCDELCCEDCMEYQETHPATRLEPSDGIYVCPNCVGDAEAGREEYELRRAEDRADERSLRQIEIDNALW